MNVRRNAPTPKPLIAVVEPDDALRDSLVFSLRIDGYDVCAYASPADFLDSAQETRFDCLVLAGRQASTPEGSVIGQYRKFQSEGKVVLLGDGRGECTQGENLKIVVKPLVGGSVNHAVAALISQRTVSSP